MELQVAHGYWVFPSLSFLYSWILFLRHIFCIPPELWVEVREQATAD
jgi:hypothetical protein